MRKYTLNQTMPSGASGLQRTLLCCGIAASVLYSLMMMTISYKGYHLTSQTVSELSAIGAPTRPLWLILGVIYQILMTGFGIGIWISAGQDTKLRITGVLIILAYGAAGFLWPFAPMHQREALASGNGNNVDNLHIILGIITVCSDLLILALGAASLTKRFRNYSICTFIVLIVFGVLTGMDGPKIGENQPTPWVGVWERINILAFLTWTAVLGTILLRKTRKKNNAVTTPQVALFY
jgi:hypothetical protein